MPEPTGGMPTIEEVTEAHAEHFRLAYPGWKERLDRDWEKDRKFFQVLVVKGVDAHSMFQIAWMAGYRAALVGL